MISFTYPPYFSEEDLSIEAFQRLCGQTVILADYPLANAVEHNVVIYEAAAFHRAATDPVEEQTIKAELCRLLKDGPGVFAVKSAYSDLSVIDRSTALFQEIVAEEKASGLGKGDHFGNNERLWNSLQKACLRAPDLFIDYYSNTVLAMASEAWLGPAYQVTAQMNNVKPGGKAQSVHRDYHLGFQSPETVARYPAHAQVMSPFLTLQGAIAHGETPLESGPTLLLPFSQQFPAGYLAYRRTEFKAYFEQNKVQLPLQKGDMLYFSPALFHGAGTNVSNSDRIVNLLQVSSAFGRTMETLSHDAMAEAVYPALLARVMSGTLSEREIENLIAATADGYAFPTNLDSDPPLNGNAPQTGQDLMRLALAERWPLEVFIAASKAYASRRKA